MSGVLVIGELLRGYAPLTSSMPTSLIMEDELPQDSQRGIVVASVSAVDRNILQAGSLRRVIERVQVTVFETSVRARRATMELVRKACADRIGDFAGVTAVSVLLDGSGPDMRLSNPTMYLKLQDFSVSYNEAT